MYILIVQRPSFSKIPFYHLRLFAILNLTKSEHTLQMFSNVILQIPPTNGNSKGLLIFLKLL